MKGATLAAGALLATAAQAAGVDGVVQWDIAKRQGPGPKLNKRASSTAQTDIANKQMVGGYFAECKVGTPPQTLTLQLDTGSSDIWVPSSKAQVCTQKSQSSSGCTMGTFTSSSSSSFQVVGQGEFDISYVDGSHAEGDYFTDVFSIGGASLTNVTMGLGSDTDIPYGLVGVGYASNEAIVSTDRSFDSVYPNLPVSMVQEGVIKTNAYSLWLNDLDSSTGSLLFGGIDTEKYHGDLTSIRVYKDSSTGTFSSFIVALTSLQATSSSGSDTLTSREFPIPVVLDSGTTLSYLPQDLALQVWNEVGAIYTKDAGVAVIPCSMQNSGGWFSFGFAGPNGPKINVTMDELVLDLSSGTAPKFTSGQYKGQDACEFGIQNSSSDPFLLGDTFLRSAYVVYDLVNNQIGIAPTDFNATDSNIVPFPSSGAPIPSATTAPNQNQVTATAAVTTPAYAAASGFTSSASSGSSGSGSNKNAASMPAPLDFTKLAVMGVAMGFTFLGGGLFLL